MKTQNKNSVRVFSTTMIVVTILSMSSCSAKQDTSVKDVVESTVAKVQVPNVDINTAALMGNLEAVEQHIKAGTDINSKDPIAGSTPLITAIVFDKPEVAKALIEAGADLDIKNNDGSTALHSAAFFCHTEIVKLLLNKGADKSIKNKMGATALQSVSGPFEEIKPVYEFIGNQLKPMGLKLDLAMIEATRSEVAELLQ